MNRRLLLILGLALLGVFYAALPLLAGCLAVGDRRGPKVYPESAHEVLYLIGWESAGRDGKPRIGAVGEPPRPWFYAWHVAPPADDPR